MKGQDDEGQTPLHKACTSGTLELVNYLVTNGADSYTADINGWTPLHCACANSTPDIISFLGIIFVLLAILSVLFEVNLFVPATIRGNVTATNKDGNQVCPKF